MSSARTLSNLRTILRGIRSGTEQGRLRHSPAYSYVMTQSRRSALVPSQHCMGDREAEHLADTYATYLDSSKRYQALYHEYHHAEISTEDAASRVGLKLPHDTR